MKLLYAYWKELVFLSRGALIGLPFKVPIFIILHNWSLIYFLLIRGPLRILHNTATVWVTAHLERMNCLSVEHYMI